MASPARVALLVRAPLRFAKVACLSPAPLDSRLRGNDVAEGLGIPMRLLRSRVPLRFAKGE